ncbi:hypothetical protein [Nocardioides sp. SR21]|uniref:hypothetical protein n=1 Tax=Nocardioides sp. SR21 TaxID=2919501 RepID=UPI001FA99A09|nr:hypothetical protein [Nocardioides sp. SR21]
MPHYPVQLDCAQPGCDAIAVIDYAHVANLTASGGYVCPPHNDHVTDFIDSCIQCGASVRGCAALTINAGRRCCTACDGTHREKH